MKNKFLIIFFIVVITLIGGYFIGALRNNKNKSSIVVPQQQIQNLPVSPSRQTDQIIQPSQTAVPIIKNTADTAVKLDVPFIVQAPFGNWRDPIFQNACEEASIVMAMGWINGTLAISPADAQNQIKNIVNFENKTFSYNSDTDVFDIQKIFQQFFSRANVSVREDITVADIKQELQKGNLVLVPAFGQALGNPNYTAPGPVEHMLVVIGYNPVTSKFITNDSGTRHGNAYQYDENTFFSAIWEYPSGKNTAPVPIGRLKKAMIIVPKQL